MRHRSAIIASVAVALAVAIIGACQLRSFGLVSSFLTPFWVGFMPVTVVGPIVRLIVSGVVGVFFLVLVFVAWRRKSVVLTTTFCSLIIVTTVVANVHSYFWYKHAYPYGWSHCCDIALHLALMQYADDHGGAFPAGRSTPEASLSLLYGTNHWVGAELLRGKSVPVAVVKEILNRGELLGPDSCGWHYVEGLREDDDPRLGLFWDKAGLGHNGERLPAGGHIVVFLYGRREHIAGKEWSKFLEEQQKLLADRTAGADVHTNAYLQVRDQ
jgi:hypothetical protein